MNQGTTTGDIHIIIADDHEIFRDGLKLMISKNPGIKLLAEAANGAELIELVKQHKPDVVITDIKMPIKDGIEAAKAIKQALPETGIIGFSMFDEDDLIIEMLEAGATGYLLKNADKEEVIEAIETVYREESYYCKNTSKKLALMIAKSKYHPYIKKKRPEFNEKEIEVIHHICQEQTNKEMAEQLFMSVRTVEGYRLRIQEKMGVKNTVGLVIYAIQHDLFKPEK